MAEVQPNSTDPKDNPSACHEQHARTGIVSNQDPDRDYDISEPCVILTTCKRPVCLQKAMGEVASRTGEEATYYDDHERRLKKARQQAVHP